jgi:hypothetical protein
VEKLKAQGSKRKEKGPEHKDFDWWKGMVVIIETIGMVFVKRQARLDVDRYGSRLTRAGPIQAICAGSDGRYGVQAASGAGHAGGRRCTAKRGGKLIGDHEKGASGHDLQHGKVLRL